MNLSTARKLLLSPGLLSFLRLSGPTRNLYRSAFVTAAGSGGVLELLSDGPRDRPAIAEALGIVPEGQRALEAWLDCGVQIGELACDQGRYRLRGRLSRMLAQHRNGVTAALFGEVTRYHYDAILHGLRRARDGQSYSLADQDGGLIAEASKILAPFVEESIGWAFEDRRPGRVLEVGCGSGHYVSHMVRNWPGLAIDAIDLQPEVIDSARRALRAQGLLDRVELAQADVLDFEPRGPRYDLITLHNNLYYFDASARQRLLGRLATLLAPRGRVLVTSSCRGGSPAIAALHLWWTLSDRREGLPERHALERQFTQAGWSEVRSRQLLPGESYFAFLATRPADAARRPGSCNCY